jgi:hypothetical protein
MDQQNVGSKRSSSAPGKIAAKSHEAAEQLKGAVVDQANAVRDKAQSAKDHTTERIRGVATQLSNVGDSLREQDPFIAGLADRASEGIEGLARYVSSTTPQSFVRDTEQLARRQPTLFFGSALLLGLAAGRFLKGAAPTGGFSSGGSGRGNYGQGNYGQGEYGRSGYGQRGYREGEYSDEQGGPLATRDDRSSGFFSPPAPERSTRSNARFQENYDAAFGRDSDSTEQTLRNGTSDRDVEGNGRTTP